MFRTRLTLIVPGIALFVLVGQGAWSAVRIAHASAQERKPRVACLVEELFFENFRPSFYATIVASSPGRGGGEVIYNSCEEIMVGAFSTETFPVMDRHVDAAEAMEAYKLKALFGRYLHHLSGLPHGTAAKLIHAIDRDVEVLIVCSVTAKRKGGALARKKSVVAEADCRAIDVMRGQRIASAVANLKSQDESEEENLIHQVCHEVASELLKKMSRGS